MRRNFWGWALLALLVNTAAGAEDLRPAIQQILSVGPRGAGNVRASKAWQTLSQASAEQLPTLLKAMNDANPLAVNWLRAAVDTIAERQLKAGQPLPAAALEKFALETGHNPRVRRLAYEWLARADDTAPERLIPGFLQDPSVELRRDAVARLMNQAEKIKKSDAAAKKRVYRQALAGARDRDQVDAIAKALKGLNDEVDLARHFGFILRWRLIGPFDNTDKKGFAVAYPPEKQVDFQAKYPGKDGEVAWRGFVSDDPYGQIDLNRGLAKHMGAAGYAAAEFMADKPQKAQLRLNSLCAVKLWLNGKLLVERDVYHAGSQSGTDRYIADVQLKPGRNVILVKCLQNEQTESWAQNWDFQLRVCDSAGTAILSTDRPAAKKPE